MNIFGENIKWWVGIVEKRDDDYKIGRCKVRIFHYHTADCSAMPTESLPWAYSITPLNDSLFSTPKEGETVIGIFLDENYQNPLMLGRLPAKEQNIVKVSNGSGYTDGRTVEELKGYPRQKLQNLTFNVDGSGVSSKEFDSAFAYPVDIGQPSTPALATGDSVPTQIDPISGTLKTTGITALGNTWREPTSAYNVVYPFNHVYESESKHLMEFDDSAGSERVRIMHRLGSGWEFHPEGSRVEKITKDNYTIVLGHNKIQIYGDADITVDGNASLYVKGDKTERIDGNYNLYVGKDVKRIIKGDFVSNVDGGLRHSVKNDAVFNSDSTLFLKGVAIHENSGSTPDVETIAPFDLPSVPKEPLSVEAQKPLVEVSGTVVATVDDTTTVSGQPTPENLVQPISDGCPVVENGGFVDGDERYRLPISAYYQIADFCIRPVYKHHMVAQHGVNEHDLVCNLSFLAKNVVDKVLEKFPGFNINSGFRTAGSGSFVSQHELGEAVDLQWPAIKNGNLNKVLEFANWMAENLPFDQIILEHGKTVWIHVSLKRNSGQNRKQRLTMYNGSYSPGFSLMGRT